MYPWNGSIRTSDPDESMHERVLAVATELGATSEGYCKTWNGSISSVWAKNHWRPLDTWNSTLSTMMPRCHGQGLKARKSSNSNGASKPQSWSEGRSSTRNDSREWDLGRGLDQKRPLHGKRWRCSRKWYMALLCDILLVHVSCWLLHFWMAEHIRLLTLKVFSSYFFFLQKISAIKNNCINKIHFWGSNTVLKGGNQPFFVVVVLA